MQSAEGFTLVELLLAIGLSVVIATLAYAGISSGIQAASALETQVRDLTELQRALSIIEDDVLQVRLRPVTHGVDYREPAFVSGDVSALLEFTRGGVANPLKVQRSELQRVRYVLRDGAVWRQHWQYPDRTEAPSFPQEVLLLNGISGVTFEFLTVPTTSAELPDALALQEANAAWLPYWDSDEPRTALVAPLPMAVRLTLATQAFGQVQRVYELP